MRLDDVRRNYDSAASYYDVATNLIFHRLLGLYRWRRKLIAKLELSPGSTVLDVGCGTGNDFPLIEQAIGSSGRIIGVDYSGRMLERARDQRTALVFMTFMRFADHSSLVALVGGFVLFTLISGSFGD